MPRRPNPVTSRRSGDPRQLVPTLPSGKGAATYEAKKLSIIKSPLNGPMVVGAALVAFALALFIRPAFGVDSLGLFVPGAMPTGFASPILFLATGTLMVLLSSGRSPAGRVRGLSGACLVLLLALPLGYLIETFAGIELGIDFVRSGAIATASNPHPGRLSPNASVTFLLIGVAFWLRHRQPKGAHSRLYKLCTIGAGAIGMTALVGYAIGLESLYRIDNFNLLLPVTAGGLSVAAAGLWMLLPDPAASDPNALQGIDRRIARRSLVVLTLVALGAGVAGFAAMRATFEESLSQNLLVTASTNAKALDNTVELSLWFPRTASTRPPIRKALATLSESPNDAEAKALLGTIAKTFLPLGVAGLEFHDARGALVASVGERVVPSATFRHRLAVDGLAATLAWKDGYLLATEIDVVVDGRTVGRIVAEQRLVLFDSILADLRGSGEGFDAGIGGRAGNKFVFASTKFRPQGFELDLFDAAGQPSLPVVHGLLGRRGVEFHKDGSGINVVSAYAPIGAYGIALAVKTDVYSLYAPLRSRPNVLMLCLAGIVGFGFFVQRNQVRPVLMQLVDSQARLRAMLEDQSELVSLAMPDGTLTYVNPAYARHFDLQPSDMIGANLFDHVEPLHREAVRTVFATLISTGQMVRGENRMVAVKGGERWVAWSNNLQTDKGVTLIHSVGRDVTARKLAELALRSSQAFLARTGRVAGVGGWELDLASNELTWSDETRRIHEVANDYKPALESAIQFYAPESRAMIEAAVRAAVNTCSSWDLELQLITASGRSIWVRAQGECELEDGKPARLIGAFQDITERKLLQQRLDESERFVRKITDSLPVRIAYVDTQSRYQFANLAHSRRFGLDREQILGRTRSDLTKGLTDGVAVPRFEAALAGEEQCYEFDEVVQGAVRRIESRLIPDLAADGTVRGLFTTGIDITERSQAERALRELAAIFDNTPDYVVQTDSRGGLLYMNPATRALLGISPEASIGGRNFGEFNTPETNRQFVDTIVPAVRACGVWTGETTVYAAAGRAIPVSHMVIAHRGADGRIERFSAVMRDISAQVAAQEAAERNTVTLRSISEAIPDVVAVVGSDGRYRFVNSAFERWYGSTRDAIVGRSLLEVLGLRDYERSRPWIDRVLAGEAVSFERDYEGRTSAAHLVVSYIPLRLADGSIDGFIGVSRDITRHKQEEARLQQLAQRDPLTGLLNRAGFERYLDDKDAGDRGAVSNRPLALLYIDLDRFKPVNDTHGHPVGDQVLRMFAQRVQRVVRPSDAVARLGGDEFAVALAGVRENANAFSVADKVLAAAEELFSIGTLQVRIGASIGVAFAADHTVGWRDLVKSADARLYEAKAAGRGRYAGQT